MVDGAIVLVDAAEGPMPQTKFVVSKALKIGLRPIVAINKVDRPDARPTRSSTRCSTSSRRSTPPTSSSTSRSSTARPQRLDGERPEGPEDQGLAPLFDLVLEHVPPAKVEEGPFRMLGTLLEANPFLGRIVTGRITSGTVRPNQTIKVLDRDGKLVENGPRLQDPRLPRPRAPADRARRGRRHRLHRRASRRARWPTPSARPRSRSRSRRSRSTRRPSTMSFIVNDSPLAGTEGDKVTSRMIRDRLFKEAEGNVTLKIEEKAPTRTRSTSRAAASCSSRS